MVTHTDGGLPLLAGLATLSACLKIHETCPALVGLVANAAALKGANKLAAGLHRMLGIATLTGFVPIASVDADSAAVLAAARLVSGSIASNDSWRTAVAASSSVSAATTEPCNAFVAGFGSVRSLMQLPQKRAAAKSRHRRRGVGRIVAYDSDADNDDDDYIEESFVPPALSNDARGAFQVVDAGLLVGPAVGRRGGGCKHVGAVPVPAARDVTDGLIGLSSPHRSAGQYDGHQNDILFNSHGRMTDELTHNSAREGPIIVGDSSNVGACDPATRRITSSITHSASRSQQGLAGFKSARRPMIPASSTPENAAGAGSDWTEDGLQTAPSSARSTGSSGPIVRDLAALSLEVLRALRGGDRSSGDAWAASEADHKSSGLTPRADLTTVATHADVTSGSSLNECCGSLLSLASPHLDGDICGHGFMIERCSGATAPMARDDDTDTYVPAHPMSFVSHGGCASETGVCGRVIEGSYRHITALVGAPEETGLADDGTTRSKRFRRCTGQTAREMLVSPVAGSFKAAQRTRMGTNSSWFSTPAAATALATALAAVAGPQHSNVTVITHHPVATMRSQHVKQRDVFPAAAVASSPTADWAAVLGGSPGGPLGSAGAAGRATHGVDCVRAQGVIGSACHSIHLQSPLPELQQLGHNDARLQLDRSYDSMGRAAVPLASDICRTDDARFRDFIMGLGLPQLSCAWGGSRTGGGALDAFFVAPTIHHQEQASSEEAAASTCSPPPVGTSPILSYARVGSSLEPIHSSVPSSNCVSKEAMQAQLLQHDTTGIVGVDPGCITKVAAGDVKCETTAPRSAHYAHTMTTTSSARHFQSPRPVHGE